MARSLSLGADDFLEMVLADTDLLRSEFDALVRSEWGSSDAGDEPRPATTQRRGHDGPDNCRPSDSRPPSPVEQPRQPKRRVSRSPPQR